MTWFVRRDAVCYSHTNNFNQIKSHATTFPLLYVRVFQLFRKKTKKRHRHSHVVRGNLFEITSTRTHEFRLHKTLFIDVKWRCAGGTLGSPYVLIFIDATITSLGHTFTIQRDYHNSYFFSSSGPRQSRNTETKQQQQQRNLFWLRAMESQKRGGGRKRRIFLLLFW